ncbi:hypothetical protein BVH01_10485 [Pseudomonas sp. PA1(2017)]|uniref:phospholipase D family protein n=1 Tax=Pseudomonas sp. PA1(2017) TaxID=1932113 RepID=UPI0009659377|nr:phospholipase D family protein [Pseudomonas sp. PA1(2017)]OLU16980.1 hypothetical protein BVH01_10485 [Pseudomonas sp. PA1(2017)]
MREQISLFVRPDDYKQRLEQLLDDEDDLSLAIAFWGESAVPLITSRPGKKFRILCNLKSGGTNPYVIRELCKIAHENPVRIRILQCDRLHAKVAVGNHQALIGSANVSGNGLGLGNQNSAHWLEAGMLTSDVAVVASARGWFDELWRSSQVQEIDDQDIEAAIKIWTQNRRTWTLPGTDQDEFDLSKFSASDLEGLPAYVLLYRSRVGAEAEASADTFKAQQQESAGGLDWWPFESWPSNLSDKTMVDHLAILYGTKGRVSVDGVCRMIGKRLFFTYDGGEPGTVDMALSQETLLSRPFGKTARKLMAAQLKPLGREIWNAASFSSNGHPYARRLHISELARVLHQQRASEAD